MGKKPMNKIEISDSKEQQNKLTNLLNEEHRKCPEGQWTVNGPIDRRTGLPTKFCSTKADKSVKLKDDNQELYQRFRDSYWKRCKKIPYIEQSILKKQERVKIDDTHKRIIMNYQELLGLEVK